MAKTVVILGAAYSGIPVAHYLLKHTAAKVKDGLKVVLVAPNSDFYWHNASVRGILPGQIPDDKLFYPIAASFSKYPTEHFDFVLGKAHAVDPANNSLVVRKADGFEQTIQYDELVIATGSSYKDGSPFKDGASTEDTKAALSEWRKKIDAAKTIVVAGGGATGVEVAAELGEE
jgi:NADH dehydrogenase FAD-containing subunit